MPANLRVPPFYIFDYFLFDLQFVVPLLHLPAVDGGCPVPCQSELMTKSFSFGAVLLIPVYPGRGAGVLADNTVLNRPSYLHN